MNKLDGSRAFVTLIGLILPKAASETSLPSATTTDFIKMSEQVGGIFVNPHGTGALEFVLPIAAGKQSHAKSPRSTCGQHIPDRIADHDRVLDLGTETIGRRQEKVRIRLGMLDLITSHHGGHGTMQANHPP